MNTETQSNESRKEYYREYMKKYLYNNTVQRENLRMITRKNYNMKKQIKNNAWLSHILRTKISLCIKTTGQKSIKNCLKYICCDIQTFREHIEKQFKDDMNWNNYGTWVFDRIIPQKKFDLTQEEDRYKCFNYKNIQPLWKHDNLVKHASYDGDINGQTNNIINERTTSSDSGELQRVQHETTTPSSEVENGNK